HTISASFTTDVSQQSTAASGVTSDHALNSICSGETIELYVNGGSLGLNADWVWYTDGCGVGSVAGTGETLSVSPTANTTYWVRAEGTCNNTGCQSIDVTVNTTPSGNISILSSPSVGCNGNSGNVTISSIASASGYSWSGPSGTLFDGQAGP